MKETVKTSRTAGYLEKIFRALNRDFFGGELEEPIITIQSTRRAYGHVTVAKIWKRKEDWRHELNLGAETLNRPIEEVVATMLHEMVHLYNLAHGVQDCSRGGSYHNRKFKATEETIEYNIRQGWDEVQIHRGGGIWTPPANGGSKAGDPSGQAPKPPKKSSTRKLVCPCCGNSVRATKTVRILCMDCNEQMQEI